MEAFIERYLGMTLTGVVLTVCLSLIFYMVVASFKAWLSEHAERGLWGKKTEDPVIANADTRLCKEKEQWRPEIHIPGWMLVDPAKESPEERELREDRAEKLFGGSLNTYTAKRHSILIKRMNDTSDECKRVIAEWDKFAHKFLRDETEEYVPEHIRKLLRAGKKLQTRGMPIFSKKGLFNSSQFYYLDEYDSIQKDWVEVLAARKKEEDVEKKLKPSVCEHPNRTIESLKKSIDSPEVINWRCKDCGMPGQEETSKAFGQVMIPYENGKEAYDISGKMGGHTQYGFKFIREETGKTVKTVKTGLFCRHDNRVIELMSKESAFHSPMLHWRCLDCSILGIAVIPAVEVINVPPIPYLKSFGLGTGREYHNGRVAYDYWDHLKKHDWFKWEAVKNNASFGNNLPVEN